jgi:HAD superfamily hydrolase (TIGR01509 family)
MALRIKGILFDLGDTLLDFGEVDVRSLFESGGRLGYEYLKKLGQPLPSFEKFHRRQLWAVRWNYLKSRFTRREFNALDLIGRLSRSMNQRLTPEQTVELAWLWYKPLSECARVEQGLRKLLEELCKAGLTLGVVSNTFIPGQALDRHLAQEQLLKFLSVRVYSCDVRFRKPNPNVFRVALERGGLLPGETLFVGDSLRADVAGANRAGMVSVLKDPTGRQWHPDIRPRHRIVRLADLKGVVAGYNET